MNAPRDQKRIKLFHRRGTINNYATIDMYEACTAMGLELVPNLNIVNGDRRRDLFVYPPEFPVGASRAGVLGSAGFDVMTYETFTKRYLDFVSGGRVLPDDLYARRLKVVPEFTSRRLKL